MRKVEEREGCLLRVRGHARPASASWGYSGPKDESIIRLCGSHMEVEKRREPTFAEAPLKGLIRTQSSLSSFRGPTKLSP